MVEIWAPLSRAPASRGLRLLSVRCISEARASRTQRFDRHSPWAGHGSQQSVELVAGNLITLAGCIFKTRPVKNVNNAADVLYEARAL